MSVIELFGLAKTSRNTALGPIGSPGAPDPRIASSPIFMSFRPSMMRSSEFISLKIHLYHYIVNGVVVEGSSARVLDPPIGPPWSMCKIHFTQADTPEPLWAPGHAESSIGVGPIVAATAE